MTDIPHPDLLTDILAHCEASGISKAEFGRSVMGDPRFVYDLEKGRECRMATVGKVRDAINFKAPSRCAAPSKREAS